MQARASSLESCPPTVKRQETRHETQRQSTACYLETLCFTCYYVGLIIHYYYNAFLPQLDEWWIKLRWISYPGKIKPHKKTILYKYIYIHIHMHTEVYSYKKLSPLYNKFSVAWWCILFKLLSIYIMVAFVVLNLIYSHLINKLLCLDGNRTILMTIHAVQLLMTIILQCKT